jgi:HAD superfamily hydrolase (TIGR01509 family)
VVFDCDGMLVNSEAQWVQTQEEYLAAHGASLDPATRRRITGRSGTVVIATIAEAIGRDPYLVAEELLATHRQDLTDHLELMPGAVEAVRAVAARIPVAVASNSPRDMLDLKLQHMGIEDVVDSSVALEDVAEGKPAPDVYLKACQDLGADPRESLAFEDSETGAQAALNAGMHLIAVPSVAGQEPESHRRITSLVDPVLQEWIQSWQVRR